MINIKKDTKYIYINKNFIKLYSYLKKNKNISNIIILLDNNTKKFCLYYLLKKINNFKKKIIILKIKSGEYNKNIYTCIKIFNKLILYKIDKNSILINLGGGVITDLGGFIASIYKRGINYINIPTTLLGMVDASIGGKNGINFNNYKNEIGIINKPKLILINIKFINSLSKNDIFSGLGELFKYGIIYNKKYWNYLKKIDFNKLKNIKWKKIIYKAILIKNKIVNKDPNEYYGFRKILNFGHTIGHAIESLNLYKKKYISHGEAISLGMICESWISNKINKLNKKEYNEILKILLRYYNIKKIDNKYLNKIYKFIENDKKNNNNKINFSLLNKIGKCVFNINIKKKIILNSIKIMNNINVK
ncbi:MAG: 3-dehydroquinate synthase [Flavobacteriales endosymbiont of Rhyzopertha dominica]|nr:MAG: 3-dehydroquinate synthase [Candidatus Shikimatogenerans bostrichidophilus]